MVVFLMTGFFAGMLAMPLAAMSMLIKISFHSHVPPDFTAEQILSVLGKIPVWAVAGSLIGISVGLLMARDLEG